MFGSLNCVKTNSLQRGVLICRLDDDLVLHVMSYLRPQMVCTLRATCKRFRRIANEEALWEQLLRNDVGACNMPAIVGRASPGNWRASFAKWRRLDSCICTASPYVREQSPQARFLHRAACLSGWLYIFGGRGISGELNDLWILDKAKALEGSSWTHVVPEGQTPGHRQSATLTAVEDHLFMFGGRHGEMTFLNDTWLFDVKTLRWTCVFESDDLETWIQLQHGAGLVNSDSGRPCPRWAHSAVRIGERVLIFGGSAPGRCFNDLHWFDVKTRTWSLQEARGKSPPARSGHCACAMGDTTMYVFGGNTTKTSFNDLWSYDTTKNAWQHVKPHGEPPSGRVGHTINAIGTRLFVLGGRDYATNRFDSFLHVFETVAQRWSKVNLHSSSAHMKAPILRTGHCTDAHEGSLLLFGGLCADGTYRDDVSLINLIDHS